MTESDEAKEPQRKTGTEKTEIDGQNVPISVDDQKNIVSASSMKQVGTAIDASRPQTNNWLSAPFLLASSSWLLVTVIGLLNFLFAIILIGEGEIAPAIFNCLYGMLVLWVFGSTLLGAPMVFMAIKQLEQRNFFMAEKYLDRYLSLIKGLHLYQDGYYTNAVSNLALIKLARGDYHHAELLYEELVAQVRRP